MRWCGYIIAFVNYSNLLGFNCGSRDGDGEGREREQEGEGRGRGGGGGEGWGERERTISPCLKTTNQTFWQVDKYIN